MDHGNGSRPCIDNAQWTRVDWRRDGASQDERFPLDTRSRASRVRYMHEYCTEYSCTYKSLCGGTHTPRHFTSLSINYASALCLSSPWFVRSNVKSQSALAFECFCNRNIAKCRLCGVHTHNTTHSRGTHLGRKAPFHAHRGHSRWSERHMSCGW